MKIDSITTVHYENEKRTYKTYRRIKKDQAIKYFNESYKIYIITGRGAYSFQLSIFQTDLRKIIDSLKTTDGTKTFKYYAIAESEEVK